MPEDLLKELLERLRADARTEKLRGLLLKGRGTSAGGLWGSSAALLISSLAPAAPHLLVVTPSLEAADELSDDLTLFTGEPPVLFPSWEVLPQEGSEPDLQLFTARFSLLHRLVRSEEHGPEEAPAIIVAPIDALLQSVPEPAKFTSSPLPLAVGSGMGPEKLKSWLVDNQFDPVDEVELPGQFSGRGGIIDLFPYSAKLPLRVEFFGDLIESVRSFDPSTQRSLDAVESLELVAISKSEFAWEAHSGCCIVDYLPKDACVVLIEPAEVEQRAVRYTGLAAGENVLQFQDVYRKLTARGNLQLYSLPAEEKRNSVNFSTGSVQTFTSELAGNLKALGRFVDEGLRVLVTCANEAAMKRLDEILADAKAPSLSKVKKTVGRLSRGFKSDEFGVAIVSDRELFSRYSQRRERRRLKHGRPIESFLELKEGDYVVHLVHGIGRFAGLTKLEGDGAKQDHLVIQYRDKARLYVPASRIELVQRYVGIGAARPSLDKLGGTAWTRRKAAAGSAVANLAKELLSIQAVRLRSPGISYPPDTDWQREFEASFFYEETEDQLTVAERIKEDMETPKPMDRLICGDVGYGKTELAMRAAFKAVSHAKQVAVLVPTTILAQQHYKTFTERMAEYPVEIEVLSRFRTDAEQRDILDRTQRGLVDVLIGTHRLIQPDVKFHDLGLVIIDEEQRFGVVHKEKLKQLRETVDVLTMTATPIPRTLHMALLGIKDISSLETPPRDRLAIETRVLRFEPGRIRDAVLRELNRDGQVFFVHNRVYNIHTVAGRIQGFVPEARIGIAHGQMHEHELENAMAAFIDEKIDVLVTTTIIESGLDIPNANTIFINDADMFGLAELHQLRGRVGRYKHRAYAYLLLPEQRPVSPIGQRRLRAIEELSQLGAGFEIALRDLEIRGAGNILGAEQSGHIAAIGYELYSRLLDEAVRRMKGQPVPEYGEVVIEIGLDEFIPESFIPSPAVRMKAYRRLCAAMTREDIASVREELQDRFGPPPQPVLNMIALAELRHSCKNLGISHVRVKDGFLILKSGKLEALRRSLGPFDPRIVDDDVYLPLSGRTEPSAIATYLKKILKAALKTDKISSASS